jgi:hypothetical protein
VQGDGVTLTLKAYGTKRLKVKRVKLLSSFASKFNLRRYIEVLLGAGAHPDPLLTKEDSAVTKVGVRTWWSPLTWAAHKGQGLKLVHFSAQLGRFLWDRACA